MNEAVSSKIKRLQVARNPLEALALQSWQRGANASNFPTNVFTGIIKMIEKIAAAIREY